MIYYDYYYYDLLAYDSKTAIELIRYNNNQVNIECFMIQSIIYII